MTVRAAGATVVSDQQSAAVLIGVMLPRPSRGTVLSADELVVCVTTVSWVDNNHASSKPARNQQIGILPGQTVFSGGAGTGNRTPGLLTTRWCSYLPGSAIRPVCPALLGSPARSWTDDAGLFDAEMP